MLDFYSPLFSVSTGLVLSREWVGDGGRQRDLVDIDCM